jgi:hypothetical protein
MFRLDLAERLHKTFGEINQISVSELKLWAARANIKDAKSKSKN